VRKRLVREIGCVWIEDDEPVAENSTFFPNQQFNDLGIGSALYVSMERMYRALGIRRVTLLAVDVGVYVWARQGFAFSEPEVIDSLSLPFETFVRKYDPAFHWDTERFRSSWIWPISMWRV